MKIHLIPELMEFDRGDGACRYLVNNECSIYENRPLICRIDEMYEEEYSKSYTKEEFYQLNLKVCHELQAAVK